jgi:glutamine amidotransferase
VTRIAVIDHGAGNLVSIARGLAVCGAEVEVITEPRGMAGAAGVVLPGVGSAAAAYRRLESAGLVDALRQCRAPLLGICVGLQLLFDGSEEGDAPGLGLIPGRVRQLQGTPRLPHIGWNEARPVRPDPLFAGIDPGETFYFVHSFAPCPADPQSVLAITDYEVEFVSAARLGMVAGVQFHPERSGSAGLRLLSNFVAECEEAARAA